MKILRLSAFVLCSTIFSTISFAQGYKVGDVATDFSLKNVDQKNVSFTNFPKAKGFIVIFTCNLCPYAKAYEDRILALDKKYQSLGYPVIAINPNDPIALPADAFDSMVVRAQEKKFTFPYLFDEGQKIYPQYGATKTPHVFIVEKTHKGNIVRYIGAIDDNYKDAHAVKVKYVENAVNALLQKKPIETIQTKAIGCTIKAKNT